jgi:hypothetical protein
VRRVILAMICGLAMIVAVPAPALADGAKCNRWTRFCKITSQVDGADSGNRTDDGSALTQKPDGKDDRRVQEARKKFSAALADYDRRLAAYTRCMQTLDPSLNSAGCGSAPTPPTAPQFRSDSFSGRGITAGQAAAVAVARLQLPTIAPGIGPSPTLNPWNMAAVGYPLWLWADGATHVGPA